MVGGVLAECAAFALRAMRARRIRIGPIAVATVVALGLLAGIAVYMPLRGIQHSSATALEALFTQVTRLLQERWPELDCVPYARFAPAIVALDQTTLDPLLRKLGILRGVPEPPPGQPRQPVLGGALRALFDVRRQQWLRIDYLDHPHQNERKGVEQVLPALAPGTLLLFDLGYFSFPWLDRLTQAGSRKGTSVAVA